MHVAEQALMPERSAVECCSWYVACTRSRHEKVVDQTLREKGMESFLPLRNVQSQWKDRRKWVDKPLFPGYLFVRLEKSELYRVMAVRGLAYLVSGSDVPLPVPDEQVQAVQRLVEGSSPVMQWPWLKAGRRVRVTTGPLAGIETYIVKRMRNGKCYLVVSVELLGRSVAVEIDPRCVEVIL